MYFGVDPNVVIEGSKALQQQALGAISGLLIGQMKEKLGRAIPVDVIKLDIGNTDRSGATYSSMEVGKYLRDNLYLSYTHRFGSPSTILRRLNNDQVGLEWYFLPDYQLNLLAGDQGRQIWLRSTTDALDESLDELQRWLATRQPA